MINHTGKTWREIKRSLQYYGPELWNYLPNCVRDANSVEAFKTLCKSWLLSKRHVNQ